MHDTKGGIKTMESHAAKLWTTGAKNGVAYNFGLYRSASFFITIGAVLTGGTLDGKLQWSATENFSSATDDDGTTGNTYNITQATAVGVARMHVVRAFSESKPWLRAVMTVGTASVTFGVTFIGLPKVTPVSY